MICCNCFWLLAKQVNNDSTPNDLRVLATNISEHIGYTDLVCEIRKAATNRDRANGRIVALTNEAFGILGLRFSMKCLDEGSAVLLALVSAFVLFFVTLATPVAVRFAVVKS